jgi:uncharacterized membrane protein YphA (DoxX/SURF4 family)
MTMGTIALTGTTAWNTGSQGASRSARASTAASAVLWILQVLLAGLFLFAGGMKLIVPIATMTQQMPVSLPGAFIRFIGVAEVLGALGLLLPGLIRVRTTLTPLAAAGLALIMAGAVGFTLGSSTPGALVPAVTGISAALVGLGRAFVAPHRARR